MTRTRAHTRKPRCHYDAERGWLTPEHQAGCDAHGCAGCRPCGKNHCALRGRCPNHVDADAGIITCPECIGATKRDLQAIVDLAALASVTVETRGADSGPLLDEAGETGIESEAFNLIGPAPLPTTHEARTRWIRSRDHKRGWCDWPSRMEPDDPHHPFAVLGKWDMTLREQYGPRTGLRVTITRAADYLRTLLRETSFPHDDEFERFTAELARCRTHLESVVHDSRTPEEGRHCPLCERGPRLRKRYAEHTGVKPGEKCTKVNCHCGDDTTGHCRTCAGHDDTWHCPDNSEHWWSERDYRDRVATDYVQHASALPARELAERLGVPLSTVRKWAARVWDDEVKDYREPALISRRKGPDGRKLYPVRDALQLVEKRGA